MEQMSYIDPVVKRGDLGAANDDTMGSTSEPMMHMSMASIKSEDLVEVKQEQGLDAFSDTTATPATNCHRNESLLSENKNVFRDVEVKSEEEAVGMVDMSSADTYGAVVHRIEPVILTEADPPLNIVRTVGVDSTVVEIVPKTEHYGLSDGINNAADNSVFPTDDDSVYSNSIINLPMPDMFGTVKYESVTHGLKSDCNEMNGNVSITSKGSKDESVLTNMSSAVDKKSHGVSKKQYSCKNCKQTFAYKYCLQCPEYETHMRRYACRFCKDTFTMIGSLADHEKKHTPCSHMNSKKPYVCHICQKAFTNNVVLKIHERTHLYACEHCQKTFANNADLKAHKKTHTYVCKHCQKTFANNVFLKVHEERHAYVYKHWKRTFAKEADLKIHEKKGPVLVPCNRPTSEKVNTDIKFKFVTKKVVVKHTEEKAWACKSCTETFTQPDDLKKHLEIHKFDYHDYCLKDAGERPYVCNHCAKTFTELGHLENHLQIHTGSQVLFSCSQCAIAFTEIEILKRHLKTHDVGEKDLVL